MTESRELMAMPIMSVAQALERRTEIFRLTQQVMIKGLHYGVMPGTDRNTLLKAGAEMLTTFFGLSPRFVCEDSATDWTGEKHGGEAFFLYRYRCQLWHGDVLVGEGLGSCNSWEKKYRYRTQAIRCPSCNAEQVTRSKYPPRQHRDAEPGWYCRECKADWLLTDPVIVDQPRGQVVNPNPADLVNTIDKMAQKRALVAATLIAVNASDLFTQDLEDFDFGPVVDVTPTDVTPAKAQTQTTKSASKAPSKSPPIHWYENERAREGFDGWTNKQGLTDREVLAALGDVAAVTDYPGTMPEATAQIAGWIKMRSENGDA